MLRCTDENAQAIKRLEAAAWTEVALGESRVKTAMRLVGVATALACGFGDGRLFAHDFADQLRDLAQRLEAKCATL